MSETEIAVTASWWTWSICCKPSINGKWRRVVMKICWILSTPLSAADWSNLEEENEGGSWLSLLFWVLLMAKILLLTTDAVSHSHQKAGEDIRCRRAPLLDLRQKRQPGVQILRIQAVLRLPHLQLETPPDKNNRPQRNSTLTQKVKSEYYSNAYACNSCSKSKTVDDDGIWHCNACNYDLCPDCA